MRKLALVAALLFAGTAHAQFTGSFNRAAADDGLSLGAGEFSLAWSCGFTTPGPTTSHCS